MIKIDISDLLCLCDKLSHRVDKQDETIEYYQKEIKRLHQVFDIKDSARAELIKENKNLKKEIDRLTELIDIRDDVCTDLVEENKELEQTIGNLQRNIGYLCDENVRLRHELNEVQNNDNNY